MNSAYIPIALRQAFLTANFFPRDAVSVENASFDQPSDKPWARLNYMPTDVAPAEMGPGGMDIHKGLFQVTLYYPRDKGDAAVRAKFEELRSVYYSGAVLSYTGQSVVVERCMPSHCRQEDNYFTLAATISWYAFVTR